ncbi:hypothetical protein Hanom_Chr07g00598821 [Helianthus anomalus]
MTRAQFAVHCGLYMKEEIETDVYTAGLVVVDRPTLLGFWQVIAGPNTWEHDKSKGRVSFISDPLYRYMHHMLATSIAARGYSREWCTGTNLFFFYSLLYRRPCARSSPVTVIACSLGIVPEQDPHLRTLPVMPTRMGFPSLWGMALIMRFLVGPQFKNRNGGIWREEPLPEQFELVYHSADPEDAVPMPDPPVDLDGAAMPQPPPPPGASQFPRHVIPGHAPGAALHPEVRAELDMLNDLVGWLVWEAQDRRERRVTRDTAPTSSSTTTAAAAAARSRFGFGFGCIDLLLFYFCYGCTNLSYIFLLWMYKI